MAEVGAMELQKKKVNEGIAAGAMAVELQKKWWDGGGSKGGGDVS